MEFIAEFLLQVILEFLIPLPGEIRLYILAVIICDYEGLKTASRSEPSLG